MGDIFFYQVAKKNLVSLIPIEKYIFLKNSSCDIFQKYGVNDYHETDIEMTLYEMKNFTIKLCDRKTHYRIMRTEA